MSISCISNIQDFRMIKLSRAISGPREEKEHLPHYLDLDSFSLASLTFESYPLPQNHSGLTVSSQTTLRAWMTAQAGQPWQLLWWHSLCRPLHPRSAADLPSKSRRRQVSAPRSRSDAIKRTVRYKWWGSRINAFTIQFRLKMSFNVALIYGTCNLKM